MLLATRGVIRPAFFLCKPYSSNETCFQKIILPGAPLGSRTGTAMKNNGESQIEYVPYISTNEACRDIEFMFRNFAQIFQRTSKIKFNGFSFWIHLFLIRIWDLPIC
jgi:hypothetical protein